MNLTKGQIYLIASDDNTYKIGRSVDAKKRFKSFSTLPINAKLLHVIDCDDMYEAEKWMHTRYSKQRVNGEWFKLDQDQVGDIMEMKIVPCVSYSHVAELLLRIERLEKVYVKDMQTINDNLKWVKNILDGLSGSANKMVEIVSSLTDCLTLHISPRRKKLFRFTPESTDVVKGKTA